MFSSINVKNSEITICSASILENEGFGGVVLWKSNYLLISSNHLWVCLCIDSRPECSITQYNISTNPGTTMELPAVAVVPKVWNCTIHSLQ